MFDDRVYKRGALTLHALRLTIGDDGLLRAAARLDGRHRHGTATTDDFRALAASVTGADPVALDVLFDAWLGAGPLPELPPARAGGVRARGRR